MHNINFIRENPTEFDNYMKQRGEHPISNKILELDKVKRETQTVLQNLLAERNSISKNIGKLKSENKDASSEMSKVDEIKNKINNLKELETIKDEELKIMGQFGNDPIAKLKARELDLRAMDDQRKREEGQEKLNLDKSKQLMGQQQFDEKLQQNEELAELRADTSLTKQMMSQEAKMVNDMMKQADVRILKGPKR